MADLREVARSLAVIAEPPGPETARIAALLELPGLPEGWQYTALFLEQLYPYASVYLDPSGMLGGEARDRVAGFWRALGEDPPTEPDHLSALLAAYASLSDAAIGAEVEQRPAAEHARSAFLWEHLSSWLSLWLAKLDKIGTPFYRAWGELLRDWLRVEQGRGPTPESLPAHLREAPPIAAPDDFESFVEALLAPARTGVIVTANDLADLAQAAGLVVRAGERRYVLRELLRADAPATLRGLAELSAAVPALDGVIGAHWSARAQATTDLLQQLAAEA